MSKVMSYATHVEQALDAEMATAQSQLTTLLNNLPEATKALKFGIHPDQEGAGFVTIMAHLEGPDMSALNASVADHRTLLSQHIPPVLPDHPDILKAPPDDAEFIVGDILVDTAVQWMQKLWRSTETSAVTLPVSVFCSEAFGTSHPRPLT